MTLLQLSVDDLETLVSELAEEPAKWQARIRFGTEQRWWTRLFGDDTVDVWLLTWVQDTGTDLHDHGESVGAFTVISGELEEVRPDGNGGLRATPVSPGEVCRIERGDVHDVRSPSRKPAVSIHAYSPPLREMTFYEQHPNGPAPVKTVSTESEGDLL
ncbi:MAG: cysteine dioxygenase family protein [Frankiaceae bacterium]|nr:cysteine dioxygenase family protein [Frankiaceae bacterium]MBV9869847.1 cysteine dioxygenase family protein [Frankiaceae bacterium]